MYDLTAREPFRAIQISAPEELKTDADFTQLFHYLISEFHRSINAFTAQYGYKMPRVASAPIFRNTFVFPNPVEPLI